MTVDLSTLHDRLAIVVKVDRHAVAERVLQSGSNFGRLVSVLKIASEWFVVQTGGREFGKVVEERLVVENKRIRGSSRPHTV